MYYTREVIIITAMDTLFGLYADYQPKFNASFIDEREISPHAYEMTLARYF